MTDDRWHDPTDPHEPYRAYASDDALDPYPATRREREPLPSSRDARHPDSARPWWEPGSATLSHLVFVDGRLVGAWQEPATGSEWQEYAAGPPPPRRPPAPPLHERVRGWLLDVCGSPAAVDGLGTAPLERCELAGPSPAGGPQCRERVQAVAELLDDLAERFFEPEVGDAFRWGLAALWREDPLTITRPASTASLAGGIAWAVGKANGLYNPVGVVRVGTIQDTLGLPSGPSSVGRPVAAALRGFRGRPLADGTGRPAEVPDLLPLGRTDVLVSAVRQQLVRIRDRAAAAATASADA
jgi:hypothetical protein